MSRIGVIFSACLSFFSGSWHLVAWRKPWRRCSLSSCFCRATLSHLVKNWERSGSLLSMSSDLACLFRVCACLGCMGRKVLYENRSLLIGHPYLFEHACSGILFFFFFSEMKWPWSTWFCQLKSKTGMHFNLRFWWSCAISFVHDLIPLLSAFVYCNCRIHQQPWKIHWFDVVKLHCSLSVSTVIGTLSKRSECCFPCCGILVYHSVLSVTCSKLKFKMPLYIAS